MLIGGKNVNHIEWVNTQFWQYEQHDLRGVQSLRLSTCPAGVMCGATEWLIDRARYAGDRQCSRSVPEFAVRFAFDRCGCRYARAHLCRLLLLFACMFVVWSFLFACGVMEINIKILLDELGIKDS